MTQHYLSMRAVGGHNRKTSRICRQCEVRVAITIRYINSRDITLPGNVFGWCFVCWSHDQTGGSHFPRFME